jgi:hypothetical protein
VARARRESEVRGIQRVETAELEREEMRVEYEQRLENERTRYQDLLDRMQSELNNCH